MRAALLSLFILAAPAFAADEDKAYFPLKIGTKWTYKVGGQEDKFVVTAVKEEEVGKQACVKFQAKLKDLLIGSEHIAIMKDGVYRFMYNEQTIEPPICFFKASAKKGDTWKQDFKVVESIDLARLLPEFLIGWKLDLHLRIFEINATGIYTLDVEDVEVPAGKFKDALVIRGAAVEKQDTTKTTIWYAKNLGMVKQVIELGDAKIVLELEKMEAPAK